MFEDNLIHKAPDGTAFCIKGPTDAQVLVLIHGLGLSHRLWDKYVDTFAKRYRVIRYDLFGHGDSSISSESASLTVYSDQVANLLKHLDITSAIIVGFSIGGMINRRFAMDYPSMVERLVILNSPHNRGAELQNAVEDRARKVRQSGAMSTMDDALIRWFTPNHLQNGNSADFVRKWRELVDAESYAQAAWVLANGVRELTNSEFKICTPTLVMTCENDSGSTPKMSFDIASEINGAKCRIVPKLQHLGIMENTEDFIEPILDFLESK